ncbi:molybdopterin-dependent oxidoreductase [Flammeovirgaceae bacterium SG7u.111]|nr:molybdopterin-dependent oxidoreductase [Flammeovirgaceae bacterium SG7u.132]WPO33429.1 molybdopterin-dependent oxidoreductase [Flammeovirgaceae bacterium SG7u.111]
MQSLRKSYKTTCSYCGVGCGIEVSKNRNGQLVLKGDEDHPVNKGMLCSKGMNLHYTVQDHSDRIMNPKMRWSRNHPLERVSWDTALTRASAVFKTFIKQHGPDSVGFYVSGQCTTEEYYLVNKLTKGFFGTNNIDTNSRLCMSGAVVGYVKTLGEDAVPVSYDDIEKADCFFITGANPAWCHPILFRRIEAHKENNPDTKIIVVDPRVTQSCALADLHLQIRPGTDTVLYHAIGRCLIENGDVDMDFINNHANGYKEYRDEVMKTSLEEASTICGVTESDIRLAASYIGNAKGYISMWAMGLNQSTDGVNRNLALLSLNLITGHIGKPGSGPFSLTGQPNAMGGREVGGMANLLAAHRVQGNAEHRDEVAKFWGVDSLPDKPGKTATQMFEALRSGEMKAIWIVCTNPSVSMPDAKLVDEALKQAKFVIVQDISTKSDTAKYADLVLPAAGWLEKEGTMTNSERRISYLNKVVSPPGEARPDWEIFCDFAKKMGYHGFDFKSAAAVYDEHCQLTKGTNIDISGLSYKRLQAEGTFQWPVPSTDSKGTKRLFTDKKFYTPNQKANILISGASVEAEPVTPEFPLILTTGRIRDQWHTMTRTGKVNRLNKHIARPFLEIHPNDAAERGIADGDIVKVTNDRGEVKVSATITESIREGVIFLPMHWGKIFSNDFSRANNLTNSAFDPQSKQPGFKYSAVQVTPLTKKKEKVIIIGAGAAGYRFINTYRELNQEDELHVFSKEKYPFYNRVLLPEYVNGQKDWENLLKFRQGEFEALKVHLHNENSIELIDRDNKKVLDAKGEWHSYDKLIVATGSRAFVPPDAPMHLPGLFTVRSRQDADRLKLHLNKDKNKVLVIGGGLLGLELSAALTEIDVDVTIIQLSSRLMERQLDATASNMLIDVVEDMGINVYLNDQVQELSKSEINENGLHVKMKSGRELDYDAVVYAIGTRPNIEIAKNADLVSGRGIKVNSYLQTSDPDIFALGEVAEHEGKINGITAAAEKQADISARFIAGDPFSIYNGNVPMNILKFANLDLCSIGMVTIPANEKDYEEVILIDKSRTYYKKCLVKQDKLVGAIMMGDKAEFAEFKRLIEEQTELSEKRGELLRGASPGEPMIGELVCSCGNVGKGNIEKAVTGGCHHLKEVCMQTGAGLGCGSCKPEVKNIIDEMLVLK